MYAVAQARKSYAMSSPSFMSNFSLIILGLSNETGFFIIKIANFRVVQGGNIEQKWRMCYVGIK